jgi:hypothetical protein
LVLMYQYQYPELVDEHPCDQDPQPISRDLELTELDDPTRVALKSMKLVR